MSIEKYVDGSTLTSDASKSIKPTKSKTADEIADEIKFKNLMTDKLMKKCKFDYIIQNPPYNGSLHLDFLTKGLDLLKEDGKMSIIEPATWLINIRKNGKAKIYDEIKRRIDGHVEKVVIENLNGEFGTGLYVPFATTTIDMSRSFEAVDFVCCGEKKDIKDIYGCNLVGDYSIIWGILDKTMKYGDMMSNHITKEDKGRAYYYTKFSDIIGGGGCSVNDEHNGLDYNSDAMYSTLSNGSYMCQYVSPSFAVKFNDISNDMAKRVIRGNTKGETSDKDADCLYDTKEHLENWKHFIFNNKLPLFINICLTIDQHNNSKQFMPWLVDKQYTDEEINQLFGFTEEEIKFIDRTLKKYERQSPWFKRYMCGPDSVTDQEVMDFMNSL